MEGGFNIRYYTVVIIHDCSIFEIVYYISLWSIFTFDDNPLVINTCGSIQIVMDIDGHSCDINCFVMDCNSILQQYNRQ